MIRYLKKSKAYSLLDRVTGKMIVSRGVKFIEIERSNKKPEVTFGLIDDNYNKKEVISPKILSEPMKTRSSVKE